MSNRQERTQHEFEPQTDSRGRLVLSFWVSRESGGDTDINAIWEQYGLDPR